jgi:DNA-binding transcriptional LysR family regulator
VRLFARTSRGVALTEAGEAFLPHAEASVREAERAASASQRVVHGEQGVMHIGFTSSASLNPLVPAIISGFRAAYPEVELRLVEQTTTALLATLRTGSIDTAFLRPTSAERESLVALALPDERLWIALPARHRLASRKQLKLATLSAESFVSGPRSNGSLLFDTIVAACHNAGFSPRIVQQASQMVSTVNLVAAGAGVALVPQSVRQLHPENVSYVRISGSAPSVPLWLVHSGGREPSAAIRNFMQHARGFLKARSASVNSASPL